MNMETVYQVPLGSAIDPPSIDSGVSNDHLIIALISTFELLEVRFWPYRKIFPRCLWMGLLFVKKLLSRTTACARFLTWATFVLVKIIIIVEFA